jgi:hypothetical protein
MPEPDYWTPAPIWSGQTAHVIASGPSATPEVIERLRGQNVVVVNSTVLSAPWAPVWFFQDTGVVFQNRSTIARVSRDGVDMAAFAAGFSGLVVTTSRRVKAAMPSVRLVKAPSMKKGFPPPGSAEIRSGRSSGQTAISVSVGMGAVRVELHGFDMRVVDGREHHHREYEARQRNLTVYERHFLPAFTGWNAQAIAAGVMIVNATPGSALREFPMTGDAAI